MIWILLIVAVLAVAVAGIYNSIITLKNKCDEAWSDIDTQLKRRYDLIPNLVETVKGYAAHESQTLENVIKARNMAMQAGTVQEKENAENMITGALKSLFALSESYPELKANENFMNLQSTLKEIEEHIQLSRRYYNATARDFNIKIEVFPNNIFANMFGFKKRDFFQINADEKENVKVSFAKEAVKAPEETK
jgi:LemA protein